MPLHYQSLECGQSIMDCRRARRGFRKQLINHSVQINFHVLEIFSKALIGSLALSDSAVTLWFSEIIARLKAIISLGNNYKRHDSLKI